MCKCNSISAFCGCEGEGKKPQRTDGEFSMAREMQRLTCAPLFLFSEKVYIYIVDVFLFFFFTKSDVE